MPIGVAMIAAKEAAKKTIKETAKQIAKETKKDALKGKLKQAVKAEIKEEVKDKVVEEIDDKVMDVGAVRKASSIAKGDGLKGKLSQAVKGEVRERVMEDINENIVDTGVVQKAKTALDAAKTPTESSEKSNTVDSNESKKTESTTETNDSGEKISDSDDTSEKRSLRDKLSEAVKDDENREGDMTAKSETTEQKSDASKSEDPPKKNSEANNDEVSKKLEFDENGTRELTDDEKKDLKEKLGWSDEKINDNCRIDENGVIHYKTDCQDKEGTTSECGVPYKRKTFEYNGVKIEGVFPEFDSRFDTQLDEMFYQSSSCKQFSECNKVLKEAIDKNPELAKMFTKEQLADIQNGNTPIGYTWHHAEEPGKMQLVKTTDHDRRIGGAAHTGGNSIWGNKSVENTSNNQKGESF